MQLRFVWWNTSLSPAGKTRSTLDQQRFVHSMIEVFTKELSADFIALGEVKDDDISSIRESCELQGFGLRNGNTKAGRSKFDTCILYKKSALTFEGVLDIKGIKGGRTYRIAQRFDFSLPDYIYPFHIFVSHWPSRLNMEAGAPERSYLGMRLRTAVEDLIDHYAENATYLLLGDYNDEPFDHSLAEHLMATRDRCLVQKKSHLLYNPFWKYLSSKALYTNDRNSSISDGGTYYHKKGHMTRWRTFDQMIFPSCFLGKTNWHLNEESTQILDIPTYTELVLDNNQIFDHYPILGVIEKVTESDRL